MDSSSESARSHACEAHNLKAPNYDDTGPSFDPFFNFRDSEDIGYDKGQELKSAGVEKVNNFVDKVINMFSQK